MHKNPWPDEKHTQQLILTHCWEHQRQLNSFLRKKIPVLVAYFSAVSLIRRTARFCKNSQRPGWPNWIRARSMNLNYSENSDTPQKIFAKFNSFSFRKCTYTYIYTHTWTTVGRNGWSRHFLISWGPVQRVHTTQTDISRCIWH